MIGAIGRGIRNPFRSRARAAAVVLLLALIGGVLALMMQATLASRVQIADMEGRVRTLIELREAGAFGTGGFGADSPVGEKYFSVNTLEQARRIPHARHLARIDEYVYKPDVDPSKKNAYAMVIGLHPGAALRAIGEIDYESARIVAGRGFAPQDAAGRVAIVGQLYAKQRFGVDDPNTAALPSRRLLLNGQSFEVVGIYTTGNDFGDNHVFIPIDAFRAAYRPGRKLSKIFVTVDSVANVERVVADLKTLPGVDVVTTPEAVSTARTVLGSLAAASVYTAVLLFAIGAAIIVFVMVLATRERVREIGTLKAIGAANGEIVLQFIAEAVALTGLGALGALAVAGLGAPFLQQALNVPVAFDAQVAGWVLGGALAFAALGSLYPAVVGIRISPIEAMQRT